VRIAGIKAQLRIGKSAAGFFFGSQTASRPIRDTSRPNPDPNHPFGIFVY
jgi:hypothetical protein